MNKALPKIEENIDLKDPSSDAETQGSNAPSQSLDGFSASIDSPFPLEESKNNLKSFLLEYPVHSTLKGEKLFDMMKQVAFEWNKIQAKMDEFEVEMVIEAVKTELLKPVDFIPSLSFQELMTQEFPKARYCIEPFFEAGTVNMVSAPPNTWKSWLLFYFSSHIAGGTDPFGKFPTEQSKVMIVNEEDSFRAIQDRFKILNITNTELPIFFRVANGSKFENKFIKSLLDELKEKDIKVVIFDSLRSMHEADENDSTAMQKILDQMKKLSREGITVIFTHHHRKKSMFEKTSSAESSRGSSAINAAISGHISLDEEDRDGNLFLIIHHLKSKAGEKLAPFEVKILKDQITGKIEFIYDGEFKSGQKVLLQTKDEIIAMLNIDKGWKTIKDFNELHASKNTIRQVLTILKNEGAIMSITRKQAIAKQIAVAPQGKANELLYSLNTETNENILTEDIEPEQSSVDEWTSWDNKE